MNRSSFPETSRRSRSRAAQVVTSSRLLRGTLSLRQVRCGRDGCRCATGEGHPSLYLVQSKEGKTRQLYIPKHLAKRAREAVEKYQQLQALIEDLSEQEWKLLKQRKD